MRERLIFFLSSLSRPNKQFIVILVDVTLCVIATYIAYSLRLEQVYLPLEKDFKVFLLAIVIFLPIFFYLGFYREIFRYSNLAIYFNVFKAILIYGSIFFLILFYFSWSGIPRSIGIIQPIFFSVFLIISRTVASKLLINLETKIEKHNILIYGAGSLGADIGNTIAAEGIHRVIAFIDDDPAKLNKKINGIKIFSKENINELIINNKVTDIFISINNINSTNKKKLINSLISYNVRVRTLPAISNIISRTSYSGEYETVDIFDLINRDNELSQIDLGFIKNRDVLISGAGGSIGSEICRQILMQKPKKILLLDHSEFSLYQIHQEIIDLISFNDLKVKVIPILCDIRNINKIKSIFEMHKPSIVYHAAAYKHVPLLQENIAESVLNNIIGTINLSRCAHKMSNKFILISTDKAVRPTNIMGATKRVAEMSIQLMAQNAMNEKKQISYSIVRFGNVLGSSGSVIPLFMKQIKKGGPVTLTHPEVKRYMMTIPEAVHLVLQTSNIANNGDICVLEMGEQIKILDIAKRLIKLNGLIVRDDKNPDGDIELKYIGLRPGEKLYEELALGNDFSKTIHPLIYKVNDQFMDENLFNSHLEKLSQYAEENNENAMINTLKDLVIGFNLSKAN